MNKANKLDTLLIPLLDDAVELISVRLIGCSGYIGGLIEVEVIDVTPVGASENTSGFRDAGADGLTDLRENFFGNNVGFWFFLRKTAYRLALKGLFLLIQ